MELTVEIKHNGHLRDISSRWPSLKQLFEYRNIEKEYREWLKGGISSYDLQCIFIGKTGYGKSSTLNTIIGHQVFATSDIYSTTKCIQTADWCINQENNWYLSFADLPGIGESRKKDKEYLVLYDSILNKTDCIVYILRADQRDYTHDLRAIETLNIDKEQVVIGINYCDKIEPVSRDKPFKPTVEQLSNILVKQKELAKYFKIPIAQVVAYSAAENWQIDNIVSSIVTVLTKRNYPELASARGKHPLAKKSIKIREQYLRGLTFVVLASSTDKVNDHTYYDDLVLSLGFEMDLKQGLFDFSQSVSQDQYENMIRIIGRSRLTKIQFMADAIMLGMQGSKEQKLTHELLASYFEELKFDESEENKTWAIVEKYLAT